jgi:cell division protein FtsI/penicillin-binding protein 2
MLAASVVGYAGVDGEGLAGIEHSFDAQVRGRAGRVTLLRDARRGMYLVGGEGPNRPIDGNDVVLTIDSVVQFIAERALGRAVEQYHAAGGVAIVMDPRDGRILAMASNPSFDPNRYPRLLTGRAAQPRRSGPVRARIDVQDRHGLGRTRRRGGDTVAGARLW